MPRYLAWVRVAVMNPRSKALPVEEIVLLYKSGMSMDAIGRRFGVSDTTVWARLKAAGVQRRLHGRRDFPIEHVISLYKSGVSPVAIGHRFGASAGTVQRRLKEAGVLRRQWRHLPVRSIISLYKSGLSMVAIGKRFGVSNWTVESRLTRAGVPLRPNGHVLPVEDLVSLYKSGLSLLVIGRRFGVSGTTIQRRLRSAGVPRRQPSDRADVLGLSKSKHEAFVELIDGLLLGDGYLAPNGCLIVGQTDRRVGWLHQIVKELRRFGCAANVHFMSAGRDFWIRGKKYRAKSASVLRTRVYEELKVQRARWYPNGSSVKRVPYDVRVSPKSIAHWFAGDGSSDHHGSLIFCTNSFTADEVEHLIRKLPVEARRAAISSRPGQSIIHIMKRNEAVKLANAIRRYLPQCCMYKLRFVRAARPIRSPMQASTVRALRQLYATGKWSQQALGDRFGVGQTEVSDVVRWRTFREIDKDRISPPANPVSASLVDP